MKKIEKYKLIEGQFSPSDSINILFALFNSKINFHQLEAFRINETNNNISMCVQHEQRARELKEAYMLIKSIVHNASDNNMDLEIHGDIQIKQIKRKV